MRGASLGFLLAFDFVRNRLTSRGAYEESIHKSIQAIAGMVRNYFMRVLHVISAARPGDGITVETHAKIKIDLLKGILEARMAARIGSTGGAAS